jgi:hypothetical protein
MPLLTGLDKHTLFGEKNAPLSDVMAEDVFYNLGLQSPTVHAYATMHRQGQLSLEAALLASLKRMMEINVDTTNRLQQTLREQHAAARWIGQPVGDKTQ